MAAKLLGYIRKSVIDDASASPERQQAVCERWAAGHGFEVEFFEDLDLSGRSEANRPGWQSLLARLDDPDVGGVIIESFDRSHRNIVEFLQFYDKEIEPRNKRLISTNLNVDLNSTQGRMTASILMVISEGESRLASDRMRAQVRHIQREQRRHFGPIPFGCDRDSATLHLIPSERVYYYDPTTGQAIEPTEGDAPPAGWERRYYHDALHQIYLTHSDGDHSYSETTAAVNQAGGRYWGWGKRLAGPQPFNRQTVHFILKRWRIYGGLALNDQGDPAGHAPILPVELCVKVGEVLQRRTRGYNRSHPRSSNRIYPLTGRIFCGACGQRLVGCFFKSNRKRHYRHTHNKAGCNQRMIRADVLEHDVLQLITAIYRDIDFMAAAELLAGVIKAEEKDAATVYRLQQRRVAKGKLIDLHINGFITQEEFVSRRRALEAEIGELEGQIAAGPGDLDIEQLATALRVEVSHLANMKPETKREYIRWHFARIEITDQKISAIQPQPRVAALYEPHIEQFAEMNIRLAPSYSRDYGENISGTAPSLLLRFVDFAGCLVLDYRHNVGLDGG